MPETLALAAEFDSVTRDQWRELVAGVLRKAGREDLPDPVEDALSRTVATGVRVAPLYTAEDAGDLPSAVGVPGLAPFVRGARAGADPESGTPAGWDVRQRHAHPDVAATKEAIAADLENGVTSLWLVLGEGAIPVDSLGDVLSDVLLDLAPVTVQGGTARPPRRSSSLVEGRTDLAPGSSLGLDPLGLHAAGGQAQDLAGLADVARRAAAHDGLRTVVVDATVFHDAGASAVEELGCSLAAGVAYLRALTDGGLSVDEAFGQLEFRYAASADQFTTIAGLRAARRLWDRVGEASGAAPEARAQRQHAVTSSVMTTQRDPWVNLLRTTVACFAAGVGGADVVTVQPFDAALGLPDAFSRRIARNTQSLLVEEGHLARVLDPAGGSWYVESLTDALARAAWDWFTEIERAGGLAAALDSGPGARPARRRVGRPRASGWPRGRTRSPASASSRTWPRSCPTARAGRRGAAVRRAAARCGPRRSSRRCATRPTPRPSGRRCTSRRSARSPGTPRGPSFAGNLFQAGGLETPSGDGVRRASRTRATTVACICGTDKDYAESRRRRWPPS